MAQVISRCMLTGHYMFMGINVAREDFAKLPETLGRKFCPFCSCEHAWQKKDSKLLEPRAPRERRLQEAS